MKGTRIAAHLNRRPMRSAALAAATLAAGLVWRLAPLSLPPLWLKYGGSALWAGMIYWLVAAAVPCKPDVMEKRAKKWHPWCSVASWYLWRACDLANADKADLAE